MVNFSVILTSPQGIEAKLNQEVAFYKKIRFMGYLHVYFNAKAPNSLLIF